MVDFEQSRNAAFNELEKIFSVSILDAKEKKAARLNSYEHVWKVRSEIFLEDGSVKPIIFLVVITAEFPLVLPKIYVSAADKQWIQYIPHLDTKGYICVFDDENISLDTSQPGKILITSIRKAQGIIEQGISKENQEDFSDEFIAYWNEIYDINDKVVVGISTIGCYFEDQNTWIDYFVLKRPFSGYEIIIHNKNKETSQFRSFLKGEGYKIEEHKAFYLGELKNLKPPFNYLNSTTYKLISESFPLLLHEYKKFINGNDFPKIVLFSLRLKGEKVFFGWQISNLNASRKGFRKNTLSLFEAYTQFQKSDPVVRLRFDVLTKERLHNRTDGTDYFQQTRTLTVAGLGSIGSNLLPFLLPLGVSDLHLIDPDILTLENTNRHLLGMDYIRMYKVDAIKHSLEQKNPLLSVSTYKKSIVTLIGSAPNIFNGSDYIFIAIGKNNIEEYVFEALQDKTLTKSVFILWVEPYLCGGHCLYINPEHNLTFGDLYDEGIFKFNILASAEYKDSSKHLTMREAGCQASYIPYGQRNIMLFLSRLAPFIYDVIDTGSKKNALFTWRGNQATQEKLNLKLSETGKGISSEEILITEL